MKKKNFWFLSFFAAITLVLSACIFESDDDGLETWLSDRGMPSNYKVQVLSINNLNAASAHVTFDSLARSGNVDAIVGRRANLMHDLVLDFAFEKPKDTSFVKEFKSSDSAGALLVLYWQREFYKSKWIPAKTAPFSDELDVAVSWKFDNSSRSASKFLDSIADISDSTWYEELANWKPSSSADTVFKMKMSLGDTAIRMPMPSALVDDLKKLKKAARLQLRISFPNAPREYRFWGNATDFSPYLAIYADAKSKEVFPPNPFRLAKLVKKEEECSDCPVLHGGGYDSLVVEIPPEPIFDALSEFYGDEFPYEGEFDVRQTVIHAQLTMARDDSKGENELGWPIQVVASSYVDSAEMVYGDSVDARLRRKEAYAIFDTSVVLKSGHQNLVFHAGDSLTLQLSIGLRDFLNKAQDGRNMKFSMCLGLSYMQEKKKINGDYRTTVEDTLYTADGEPFYVAKNDTVSRYVGYFDYSRYDFSTAVENPMTLKLWLASKRGDE